MQSLAQIRALLASASLAPRKSLGQNFLIDQNLIVRLIDSAGVAAGSLVLEVGPGTGTMTEELLGRGCRVIAAEIDRGLCVLLRDRLGTHPGFTLIEGDCLDGKSTLAAPIRAAIDGRPFTLVSNLPYGAGTGVLLALLTRHPECATMAVTVQREVADRLIAGPRDAAYGSIGIVAQCLASVRKVATLPPECFWPRPEVTSAMVVIERLARPLTDDGVALAEFCKRAFAGRRKQIRGLLRAMAGRDGGGSEDVPLPQGVAPEQRIEDLAPEQISGLERATRAR